ncbi:MAG: hypothetical protein U5R31_09295 [Acidimicrobiia bacterium]|nr:hypothetical protein [Acidimicrobiia bacterium]
MIGLMLPEEYGGSGMTVDARAASCHEELGRALAADAAVQSAPSWPGGRWSRSGAATRRSASWLPRDRVTARGHPGRRRGWSPTGGYRREGIGLTADPVGGGFALNGTKWHVPYASSADRAGAVVARTGDGVDLFLVDPSA